MNGCRDAEAGPSPATHLADENLTRAEAVLQQSLQYLAVAEQKFHGAAKAMTEVRNMLLLMDSATPQVRKGVP